MKILLFILFTVGLHGCSISDGPQSKFIRTQANVTVIDQIDCKNKNILNKTICVNDSCTIMLQQYSECFNYVSEIRWHHNKNSVEYCF